MTRADGTKQSWFQTITRPMSRLILTVLALVAFFGGIALGVALPAYQLWFQVPAIAILMVWFVMMTRRYNQANGSRS